LNRHGFLQGMHDLLAPRAYLEIGVNDGRGLALSRTRTIGVDPAFRITVELRCDLHLVKATSDDFFASPEPLAWFPDRTPDLAFIDGMHLFEYALRDFINVERHSRPASVVVLDDMLPRSVDEAARERHTRFWTGDVYKVATVLERYRPDLTVIPLNTTPTGLLLVLGLDPTNTSLTDRYDDIVAEHIYDDPQRVPDDVLHRRAAADPDKVLASAAWSDIVAARDTGTTPSVEALESLAALRGTANYELNPPEPEPWPAPKKQTVKKSAPSRRSTRWRRRA
jgi:Methyltransferase domain